MRFFKNFFSRFGIMTEFFEFLLENKKWWLVPIVLVLFIFALLIILAEASPVAPFIYTLF